MRPNDKPQHSRQSTRYKGYDYTQAGAYFITICTWKRVLLFGKVIGGEMRLNEMGEIVVRFWEEIPGHFPQVNVDAFIVMPNHVHGIVVINDLLDAQQTLHQQHPRNENIPHVKPGSLGAIVRSFKSAVTRRINKIRDTDGQPVWQRNYHDHIIRSDGELDRICHYSRKQSFIVG